MLPRVEAGTRWATFDCYGTLVDWNAGIRRELERLIPGEDAEGLLERYHLVERRVQREWPEASYRDVMEAGLEEVASDAGASLPESERDALGSSLPGWPIFPEVPGALAEARERGWRLAVLTNSDRDLIDASLDEIGVPFDATVVASEIGSYKPAHGHWRVFYESTGAGREGHVHVAQSHFHDIAPASELGLTTVWINRRGEKHEPAPTRELRDLNGLAGVLDELVPAG
jgi:2-haloacid dehalogenase